MMGFEDLKLSDYTYNLPEERIAKYPLAERDQSKLLYYDKGQIHHRHFTDITDLIAEGSTLCFNNTRVIPARMIFLKETGALIEIFLLKPLLPSAVMSQVMEAREAVVWECMVGNLKRWKNGVPLVTQLSNGVLLTADLIATGEKKQVRFHWNNPEFSFAEIVELVGNVPLPPYLNRKAEPEDKPRYQTVYSKKEGAVAAPTAGLHFTPRILEALAKKQVKESFLTLHVSAGTFQPIKTEKVSDNPMHSEQMVVRRENILDIVNTEGQVFAVGTTSMRTLESLYWFGVQLMKGQTEFKVEKLAPYQDHGHLPTCKEVFQAIADWMDESDLEEITGSTEIFIMPGYPFQVCDGLITNFHQPGSTLMLLVGAFVGDDWKHIYNEALENDYRFLSYGDSSLLMP